MKNELPQIDIQPSEQIEKKVNQCKPQSCQSDLTHLYFDILGPNNIQNEAIFMSINEKFIQNKIKYNPNTFKKTITGKIINHMPNYQIVALQITFGSFSFEVSIICEEKNSSSHQLQSAKSREEATIFFAKDQSSEIAIKCFHIELDDNPFEILCHALKQYCLLRVASSLGIGPKVCKHGGFDIVFYSRCVQFSMEKCQQLRQNISEINSENIEKMKTQLKLLHYFHIIHMDIKPQNIMYSTTYKKLVFIDYGFSQLIQEDFGHKTLSLFSGSAIFCSPEMMLAFSLNQGGSPVDLYYNDAHCLKETLEQICKIMEKEKFLFIEDKLENNEMSRYICRGQFFIHNLRQFYQHQLLLEIKSKIFFKNRTLLQNNSLKWALIRNEQKIIQFILQFSYSKYYYRICDFIRDYSPYKDIQNLYIRRMQFKKEITLKRIIYSAKQNDYENQNMLFKKLQIVDSSDKIILTNKFNEFTLVCKQSIKEDLLEMNEKPENMQMSQIQYFRNIAKKIDLRNITCNLNEIMAIISIFKKSITKNYQITVNSQYRQLQQCFKYLLKYFTLHLCQYFQDVIPIAITNLIIIEAIEIFQILEIIQILAKIQNEKVMQATIAIFRIHFIFDWITEKLITKYSLMDIKTLNHKIKQSFQNLKNTKQRTFVEYISILYHHEVEAQKISQQFLTLFDTFLLGVKKLNEDVRKQFMTLAIYKAYNNQSWEGLQTQMQLFLELQEHCTIRLKQCQKIDYIHLRLLKIASNRYENFKNTLLDEKIGMQFYFYHSGIINLGDRQLVQYINSQKISQNLQYMIDAFRRDEHKEISSIINCIYTLLKRIDAIKIPVRTYELGTILASFLNEQLINYLQNCVEESKMCFFYINVKQIFELFYHVCHPSSPQFDQLKKFLEKGKIAIQQIKCNHCYFIILRNLRLLEVIVHKNNKNYAEGLKICSEQILTLMNSYPKTFKDIYFCIEHIGLLIIMIEHGGKQIDSRYSQFIYNTIIKHQLQQSVFLQNYGRPIYIFMCIYTLVTKNSIDQYLNFHKKLLLLLQKHPYQFHVMLYLIGIQDIIRYQTKFFHQNINNILSHFFKKSRLQKWKNPYTCLFISNFLNYLIHQNLRYKIIYNMCKSVDLISLYSRVRVLNFLFTFLLNDLTFLSNKRSKIRKIMFYSSYIDMKINTKTFSKKIGVKISNSKRQCREKKILSKKWQKINLNMK